MEEKVASEANRRNKDMTLCIYTGTARSMACTLMCRNQFVSQMRVLYSLPFRFRFVAKLFFFFSVFSTVSAPHALFLSFCLYVDDKKDIM